MPPKGGTKDWATAVGMTDRLEADIASEAIFTDDSATEGSYHAEQIKEIAAYNLDMLAGLCMPEVFSYSFPPVLLAAWQILRDGAAKLSLFVQLALGIPRGHAKTTLIKLFVVWCILFSNKKFILLISATATLAENVLADIVDMLNQPNIIRLFGHWELGKEIKRQDLIKFGFRGRNIVVAAIGAGGSVRGLNIKNARPDVMVFDDVQTKECAASDVESAKLETWFIGTAMKAKSQSGCLFIFSGNMYPGRNSILRKLKDNPHWLKFISGAILADGAALWAAHRNIASLIEEFDSDIASGHPEIFLSEVMNDTEASLSSKVDFGQVKNFPYDKHEQCQGKYIIIDPSANKKGGDDVAIGYFEVFDGTPWMREAIEEKLSPGNTIRRAILLALRNRCRVIAVESTAYQYSLLYWFDHIAKQLGITGLEFVEVYSGSYSKNARITDMLKSLTQGTIGIDDTVRSRVTNQIANWNPLKKNNVDNLLDLLAYSPRVLELYGSSIATDTSVEVVEVEGAVVQEDNHAF